jgi:hypothetical protein
MLSNVWYKSGHEVTINKILEKGARGIDIQSVVSKVINAPG